MGLFDIFKSKAGKEAEAAQRYVAEALQILTDAEIASGNGTPAIRQKIESMLAAEVYKRCGHRDANSAATTLLVHAFFSVRDTGGLLWHAVQSAFIDREHAFMKVRTCGLGIAVLGIGMVSTEKTGITQERKDDMTGALGTWNEMAGAAKEIVVKNGPFCLLANALGTDGSGIIKHSDGATLRNTIVKHPGAAELFADATDDEMVTHLFRMIMEHGEEFESAMYRV